jgi:bifunctional non-homologous end joining protein LigD
MWAGQPEPFLFRIEPMLAQPGGKPFEDDNWVYEPKLDGYRLMPYACGEEVRLITRGNADYTSRFPAVAQAVAALGLSSLVLDAEIVAFDEEGQPSFEALQQLTAQSPPRRRAPVVLFCFDLLHVDGVNTRGQSYSERRQMLERVVKESEYLKLVHSDANGPLLFDAAATFAMEGLVAKRRTGSKYWRSSEQTFWCSDIKEWIVWTRY